MLIDTLKIMPQKINDSVAINTDYYLSIKKLKST